MLQLLGNQRLVRKAIQPVTSSAELLHVMIFNRQLGNRTCLEIRAKTHGLALQLRQFRRRPSPSWSYPARSRFCPKTASPSFWLSDTSEAFSVVLFSKTDASPIPVSVLRELRRITRRLFRNDINGTGNGRRAEQSRTTSTHHLHPVDHIRRNLLQTIHTGKGTENRT